MSELLTALAIENEVFWFWYFLSVWCFMGLVLALLAIDALRDAEDKEFFERVKRTIIEGSGL